jgi:hypothetical protein
MPSRYTTSSVTINLNRAEAWEVEEVLYHLEYQRQNFRIEGHFMTFETDDYVDELGWSGYRVCNQGVTRNLQEILVTLMAKDAVSVTLLSEFWSCDDGTEEGHGPSYFEDVAEQIPTLILQEVLAKRLGGG